METCHGGEAEIRRGEKGSLCDDDGSGLGEFGASSQTYECLSIGTTGTIRPLSASRGRKPVTHGKTLSFLIESLADQLKDSKEAQAREAARQLRIEQQLQQLQEALDAWRASVADVVEDSTNEA